jgi:signal transduction histidine kinase
VTNPPAPTAAEPTRAGSGQRFGRLRYVLIEWPWWAEASLLVLLTIMAVQVPAGPGLLGDRVWLARQLAALAACAALLLRRRYPIVVALVASAVFLVNPQTLWPLVVALYELAARRGVPLALGIGLLDVLSTSSVLRLALGLSTVQYGPAAVLVVPVALGFAARNRQHRVSALTGQVERLRIEQELRAEQARSAERARIAYEMHDLLAHRLSLLALQAGVLELRGRDLPEPLAARLAQLRGTSTQALTELRDLLGVLHEPPPDTAPPAQPGPHRDPRAAAEPVPEPVGADPAALHALLAESRAAGAEISAEITTALGTLPAPVRLAVYRIVREALTNARRHAPAAPVTVTIDHRNAKVHVVITNPVPPDTSAAPPEPGRPADPTRPAGSTPPAGGYGLLGLAERVAALDGTFTAGTAGDRYEVGAVLPARSGAHSAATVPLPPPSTPTALGPPPTTPGP